MFYCFIVFIILQSILKHIALCDSVDICIKNVVVLTPAITYEILRAKSLNQLLKIVINLLKQETISM